VPGRTHGALLQQEDASLPAPDTKSIAVLPFVNMSSDKEQVYFSDGMSEELLNLLAQAPDLKVIARTSSFAFKGKDVPIAEIARQLNVAHVLEGSVRKSGNTVRITAQLVRAADSVHLWSDTYDRPLDDIFTVQDEIANAIVQALQIKLAGGELSRRKGGTQNLEAYQLYLRALSAFRQNTQSSLDATRNYVEQATTLDPNYGLAWAQLAIWYVLQWDQGYLAPHEAVGRTRELARHALQLSPDLALAHAALQYAHLFYDWDWEAAEREEKQALAIDPTHRDALIFAATRSLALGRWEDAEQHLLVALVRDPLDPFVLANIGSIYLRSGRFADSETMYRRMLEVEPDHLWRCFLGKALLVQGRAAEALVVVQQEADEGARLWFLPMILQAAGHPAEADAALQSLISRWGDTRAYYVALNYAWRSDHDRTLEWLERAYQQRDSGMLEIMGEPLFKPIAHDPRFIAFLKKMNLPTEPVPVTWQ
jgi:TolB-like protein